MVQVDLGHLLIRNFDTLWISPLIQLTPDPQSSLGSCRGDEADDRCQAHQWSAAPIHADVGKEPMLNLVPFAGSGREMADGNRLARSIGELL